VKFTAIVTSHANDQGLRWTLGNLRYQTRKPDETIVFVSDPHDISSLREEFPDIHFHVEPNLNDWGHSKRARSLLLASGEFIGWFNDDDEVTPDYLEKMLGSQEATGADVVWCRWNERPDGCDFVMGNSTSGNYIVRRTTGIEAGYHGQDYNADGLFITRIREVTDNRVYRPEMLYFHNQQNGVNSAHG
jgi:GT2 family glycosyltransferase